MANDTFSSFCGGAVWNTSLTVDNTWPEFTQCFQDTVLVWVPCGFFLLFLPYYLRSVDTTTKATPAPITLVNGCRLFCCVTLATLTMVQLIQRTGNGLLSTSVAAYLADALRLVTYILLAMMTQYERLKGAQACSVPFFFWLLSLVCSTIPLYTIAMQQVYKEDVLSFTVQVLCYVIQFLCLVLTCFLDHPHPPYYSSVGRSPCPEITCCFPSYLLYYWMNKLMITGYKRDLQESDLWDLPRDDQSDVIVPKLQALWQQEHDRCRRINSQSEHIRKTARYAANGVNGESVQMYTEKSQLVKNGSAHYIKEAEKPKESPSLLRVIIKQHGYLFLVCFVEKIFSDFILLLSPLMLGALMTYLQQRPGGREWQGYLLCLGMFLVIIIKSVLFAHSMFGSTRIGMRIKASLIAAVYQKALTMNNAAKTKSTVGEVVNLMSVDAQRILDMMNVFFFAITTPFQAAAAIVLLYLSIGPSIFAGVLLLVAMVPLNSYVVKRQGTLQGESLKFKDARVRLYNEILNGIKVLKLYAWEPSFREKIREVRLKEVAVLFKLAFLNTLMSLCWDMAPYLVTLVTFVTYVLINPNNYLDAQKAFVSLSLFNILRAPLTLLSTMIMYIVQAHVSIRRVNEFLKNEDLDPSAVTHDETQGPVIKIENGCFTWDKELPPIIRNINLEIGEGRLVAVVGTVGCGKSSLISAMLGEMEKVKGKVVTRGRVAYVPQQAWIQNATVRDNVLFGKPLNRNRYRRVLTKCQLDRDLTILSAGDMTEIGEKGINLSGGQKQRVSMARAVYSDCDVYLLDDPLSAVDSHVGKAMFNDVIGNTGVLKGKTRVLVTHGVHWLPMVDEIIVMLEGTISERGSYEELVSHDGPFAQFLKTYLNELPDSDDDDPELAEVRSRIAQRLDSLTSDGWSSGDEIVDGLLKRRKRSAKDVEDRKRKRREIEESVGKSSVGSVVEAGLAAHLHGRLTTVETMETGKVKRQVFKDYANAAGFKWIVLAFLSFTVFQAFSVGANFWLKDWTGDPQLLNASTFDLDKLQQGNDYYVTIYGVLGFFQFLFLLGFNYLFWTRMVMAARTLHQRLADRLLHAPMSFFDTTPVGRILNRVSRDMETVDNTLPLIIRDFLVTFALVLLTLVVMMIQTPLSGALILPVVVLYYFLQGFYVPTARQLKRIESVTRTPIYVLFSETISGAASIRAYGVTDRFQEDSKARVDRNQIYYFASQAAVRWLQFNLDILAALLVFAAGLFALLSEQANSGDAGLSISYALQVSGTLTWMTRQICEFETNVVSVERLKEYSELDTEAEWVLPDKRPPTAWPKSGDVIFNNYQTRYREGLELVLKGVTCTIKDGEKVGIVGRTGAGKSSLTLSLFRLIEGAGGSITIDGINIADLGLHDLRSRLTILPQDPVLFSGSLRMNLDPFDEFEEQQLWTALDRAHLRDAVTAMPGHLAFECGEEGQNLSVGQRQLVCLARTLLRRTKILVLDEATAAVDMETDALIQNTIRTAFSSCTVITIAHRLNTIMDYDKIMVMDSGVIKEFSSPRDLLDDRSSAFYAMARDAGLV